MGQIGELLAKNFNLREIFYIRLKKYLEMLRNPALCWRACRIINIFARPVFNETSKLQ